MQRSMHEMGGTQRTPIVEGHQDSREELTSGRQPNSSRKQSAAISSNANDEQAGHQHGGPSRQSSAQAVHNLIRRSERYQDDHRATRLSDQDDRSVSAPLRSDESMSASTSTSTHATQHLESSQRLAADFSARQIAALRPVMHRLCQRLMDDDPTLTEIVLQDILLNDDELSILLTYLPRHRASKSVQLDGCQLRDAGLDKVINALLRKPEVTSFSAVGNFFSERSAPRIAALLDAHPELINVNLRSNKLGDSGAELLAAHLAVHPHLQSLHLGYCGIYCDGASSLRQAIENKPGFDLCLDDNPVHLPHLSAAR
ncbi:MAG: hypothetical protein H7315_05540 [Herminiimonas sp.]|nr:hypothetical protein [Herminiimonas sp.]